MCSAVASCTSLPISSVLYKLADSSDMPMNELDVIKPVSYNSLPCTPRLACSFVQSEASGFCLEGMEELKCTRDQLLLQYCIILCTTTSQMLKGPVL